MRRPTAYFCTKLKKVYGYAWLEWFKVIHLKSLLKNKNAAISGRNSLSSIGKFAKKIMMKHRHMH